VIEEIRNGARPMTRGLSEERIVRDRKDVAEALAEAVMMTLAGIQASARDGAVPWRLARTGAIAAAGIRSVLDESRHVNTLGK
jgi:hypothetical protein